MSTISSDNMTEKQLPAAPPPPEPVVSTVSSNYGYQQSHLGQPGPARYASAPYSAFGHINGMSLLNSGPPASVSKGSTVLPPPSVHQPGMVRSFPIDIDTTGQIAPPGVKPRVTATLWEDEGSLCFQVEARGVCVARRGDNHMINGTGLLDVAGMTRSRRDDILKSEKVRHVVETGPLHLQGVWIPYDRALELANKEQITEMMYPLFVHNIGTLLYHPTEQTRTNQAIAAFERRLETPSGSKPETSNGPTVLDPKLEPHHNMTLPYPQRSSVTPPPRGRSQIQRVQYLPTPPTSGGSVSSIKTYDKQKKRNLKMDDQYMELLSMDPGLDNVGLTPILPPGSVVNDQDRNISPNQARFRTPSPRREHSNKSATARSISERSTKIRSPMAIREVELEEGHSPSDEKKRVLFQSPKTPQFDIIWVDNDEGTPEALAERGSTHTQVGSLSPSQTSPQSDSERSSDSETGLLTGSERRSILLERLMSYFFELFSSCPSPVPITKAENLHATPNVPSANISAPNSIRLCRKRRIYSIHDDEDYNDDGDEPAAVQVFLKKDRDPKTPEPRPLPSFAPDIMTRASMNRSAPRENFTALPSMLYSMPPVLPSAGGQSQETEHVRVVQRSLNPQCWEHECNGREFSTLGLLLRHQRVESARDAMNRRTPEEDEIAPPTLPPPSFLDQPTDIQYPISTNHDREASFLNSDDSCKSNGQGKIPSQDGRASASGQANISAGTAVGANMRSNASNENTRPVQKRDRDGDDGEKDDRQPDKRTRLSENISTAPKRLACPYFKKDPEHSRLGRSCSGPGWGTVHRIKEHLDRNHALPPSCVRCYTAFETEAERDAHMRLQDQCQLQERPGRMFGFDAFQKEQLRSRPKGYKHMSETQKWCHIYTILFPETAPTDIPSPYYEFGSLRDSGHPVDPMTEYENFLRHEMPDRVRYQLELRIEEALNPLEETLRGQIVDIVRDVQLELFQSFRASAGPVQPDIHSGQENAMTEANDNPEGIRDSERGNNDVSESAAQQTNTDVQSDWEEQMQPFRPVPPLDFSFLDFDGELFDFSSLINVPAAQDSTYGTLSVSQGETDKDAFIWNGTPM